MNNEQLPAVVVVPGDDLPSGLAVVDEFRRRLSLRAVVALAGGCRTPSDCRGMYGRERDRIRLNVWSAVEAMADAPVAVLAEGTPGGVSEAALRSARALRLPTLAEFTARAADVLMAFGDSKRAAGVAERMSGPCRDRAGRRKFIARIDVPEGELLWKPPYRP